MAQHTSPPEQKTNKKQPVWILKTLTLGRAHCFVSAACQTRKRRLNWLKFHSRNFSLFLWRMGVIAALSEEQRWLKSAVTYLQSANSALFTGPYAANSRRLKPSTACRPSCKHQSLSVQRLSGQKGRLDLYLYRCLHVCVSNEICSVPGLFERQTIHWQSQSDVVECDPTLSGMLLWNFELIAYRTVD